MAHICMYARLGKCYKLILNCFYVIDGVYFTCVFVVGVVATLILVYYLIIYVYSVENYEYVSNI